NIINPVSLLGVVDEKQLNRLLTSHLHFGWCTRVRIQGLLLLLDYLLRNTKNGLASISAELARSYVSKLKTKKGDHSISEPLLVLCEVGIIKRVRPGVCAHVRASAAYCLGDEYRNAKRTIKVFLLPKLRNKRESAEQRRESALTRKFPYRRQLL